MENIVRRINLEGELGEKFGKVWHLNVKSPAEAVHAIDAQRKGFRKYFLDTGEKGIGYEVIIGDQGIQQEEALLYPTPMRDDYTFVPVPQGGKNRAFGMIMLGVVMFITAGMASGAFGAVTMQGGGLTGGGLTGGLPGVLGATGNTFGWGGATMAPLTTAPATFAQGFAGAGYWGQQGMLMGAALMFGGVAALLAPTADSGSGNDEQSYLFDGAINSAKQGTPVPILYGRLIVGGATISASIKSNAETSRVPGLTRIFVVGVGGDPHLWSVTTGGGPAGSGPGGSGSGTDPTGSGIIL